jgi:hypothetical protein
MEITSFGITGWLPERAGGSPRPHSSHGHSINHSGTLPRSTRQENTRLGG